MCCFGVLLGWIAVMRVAYALPGRAVPVCIAQASFLFLVISGRLPGSTSGTFVTVVGLSVWCRVISRVVTLGAMFGTARSIGVLEKLRSGRGRFAQMATHGVRCLQTL